MSKIRQSLPALGLALMLLVTACKPGAGTAEPTVAPTTAPTTAPTAQPADVVAPTEIAMGDPNEPVTVVAAETPGVCTASPLPELPVRVADETDYVKGASLETAEMVIYEYSDFQCPGCDGMAPILSMFLEEHPNIALVYRHFPLSFHTHAQITAEAAEAAGAQGKFWEMHDMLFENTSTWSSLTAETILPGADRICGGAGSGCRGLQCSAGQRDLRRESRDSVQRVHGTGPPGHSSFIFENVLFLSDIGLSLQGLEAFLTIIEDQDEIFYAEPPAMTVDAEGTYEAVLEDEQGRLAWNLLTASAPANINSFIFLANENWYDGADFFYVQDGFVAVTGDPTNSTVWLPRIHL